MGAQFRFGGSCSAFPSSFSPSSLLIGVELVDGMLSADLSSAESGSSSRRVCRCLKRLSAPPSLMKSIRCRHLMVRGFLTHDSFPLPSREVGVDSGVFVRLLEDLWHLGRSCWKPICEQLVEERGLEVLEPDWLLPVQCHGPTVGNLILLKHAHTHRHTYILHALYTHTHFSQPVQIRVARVNKFRSDWPRPRGSISCC